MNRAWLVVAVAAFALCACSAPGSTGKLEVHDEPATSQLPIPALDTGRASASGTRVYTLDVQAGRTDFGEGRYGETIGVNGSYLGPTLRMADGEKVRVNVTNSLDEMTTVHWHGLHVPAASDGGPHSMIDPGTTWHPRWRVRQEAATLWYHSHPHGQTAQQVYRGLAGMLIVDPPKGMAAPDLPSDYGTDDIPVIVQDKSFNSAGELQIDGADQASTGILGDTIVVNGRVGAFLPVTTQAVRLRVLNASNARFYDFAFSDGRQFDMVASDGGLLAHPVRLDHVQLGPAERAEIVVRMQPGETVALTSRSPELGTGQDALYGAGTFTVLELRAGADLRPSPQVPADLGGSSPPVVPADATVRRFRVQGRAINGRPMDMNRIDFAVPVGTPEVWEITNEDRQPHNFHVHNVQFRVLDMDGAPPPAQTAGNKDTVYVPPLSTVRLLVRFDDYTDPDQPYMFHCHLLLHEDMGVMGQFVVVKPGEQAGQPPAHMHN